MKLLHVHDNPLRTSLYLLAVAFDVEGQAKMLRWLVLSSLLLRIDVAKSTLLFDQLRYFL